MASNNFFSRDIYTSTFYSYVKKSESCNLNLTKSETGQVDLYHLLTKKGLHRLIDDIDYENGDLKSIDYNKDAGKKSRHKILISKKEQQDMLSEPIIVFKEPNYKGRLATESPYKWYNLTADQVRYSCIYLDNELKDVAFLNEPVKWLMKRGIICTSTCSVCHFEHKKYKKNKDGDFVWDCCKQSKLIELRGHFNFANKLIEKLPMLIYNWAIYGNIGTLENALGIMDVSFDSSVVHLVFETFRHLCQITNELYLQKLGINGKTVELITFQFKDFVVVIAIELETDLIKFKLLTKNNVSTIVSLFKEWFDQSARLVYFEKKFDMLSEYFNDVSFVEKAEKDTTFYKRLYHLIETDFDIADYPDLFLGYLHEVAWRYNFGKTPYSAFLYISEIISVQPKIIAKNRPNMIPFEYDKPVKIDELYLGRLDLVPYMRPSKEELAEKVVLRNTVRCPLCYGPFTFEGLFQHLLNHFKNDKNEKTDKKIYGSVGLGSCQHCFRRANILDTRIHAEIINDGKSNTKEMAYTCKICCIVLKNDGEYIKHLKSKHTCCDMPYGCTLCSFRSSLYHELIEHWKRYHQEVIKAYCRCCMKIFVGERAGIELLGHLVKHKKVKGGFSCENCSLSFVSNDEFDLHYYRDHIVQTRIAFRYLLEKYEPGRYNDVRVTVAKDPKLKIATRRNVNDTPLKLTEVKTLKKCTRLPREGQLKEKLTRKDLVIVKKQMPVCQECSQWIDINHYSKKLVKCPQKECNFKSHCSKAIDYPCSLHMSGFFKPVK